MANKNGYFQVKIKNGKAFIRLFPANGGEPVFLNEVREYLDLKNYVYDAVVLKQVIENLTQPVDFPIAGSIYAVEESMKVTISADGMTAVARFYPESEGGASKYDIDGVINDLNFKGITYGIDMNVVTKFLEERQYCTNYIIAKGTPPVQGRDAVIEYMFNTELSTKPLIKEDGSVDFFSLQTVCSCTKGQELARLTPEVQGERGAKVTGEQVLPRQVKALKLSYGANITLSEDGLSITSNVDGHVTLVKNKVFVSNVLELVDIDTSTGNISYSGNILIKGNVKAGFRVEADGNIDIRGAVEGAYIKATGNVIIARGINGKGIGEIAADGNVSAKFIENATITAGGFISAEAVMHSNLTATGDIVITGKKGFIVGGVIKAQGDVVAKTIGSEMGGETVIDVGINPKIKNRLVQVEANIKACNENIAKIAPVIANMTQKIKGGAKFTKEQIIYFKKLTEQYNQNKTMLANLQQECEDLTAIISQANSSESSVKVSDAIYPGVVLTINDVTSTVSTVARHSRIVRDGADIRFKPLE